MKGKCIICGKEFEYKNYYKKKCCSNECLSTYRKEITTKQHNLQNKRVKVGLILLPGAIRLYLTDS